MTPQQFAEASIQRLGFVVVWYTEYTIGERTNILWRRHQMPVPFVVLRQATKEEAEAQLELHAELIGIKPAQQPPENVTTPMLMVTD